MIKKFTDEIFKPIKGLNDKGLTRNYAISNYGRLVSYKDEVTDGKFIKGTNLDGYSVIRMRLGNDQTYTVMIHKLVAEAFCKKKSRYHDRVIHLDFDKQNNQAENLEFVTRSQMYEHAKNSPALAASRNTKIKRGKQGHKLSRTKVARLKQQIFDPKRTLTLSQLAAKYNISEMQLYRIKRGENWSEI